MKNPRIHASFLGCKGEYVARLYIEATKKDTSFFRVEMLGGHIHFSKKAANLQARAMRDSEKGKQLIAAAHLFLES